MNGSTDVQYYAEVAVPVPLGRRFTYRVPPKLVGTLVPGVRVLCPFGRRQVLAVLLKLTDTPPVGLPLDKIKNIAALVDQGEPAVPPELLSFLEVLAAYYFAPIGEVLRLALPAVERDRVKQMRDQGQLEFSAEKKIQAVGGREVSFVKPTDQLEAAGSLRGQTAAVLALLRSGGEASVPHLTTRYKNARNAVKRLVALGLVAVEKRRVVAKGAFDDVPERDEPPVLNAAQATAVQALVAALSEEKGSNFLLHGVTGSGKTEVYMHAIATALELNRGALCLVPEIALTPQLTQRFRARFGNRVAVLHSGLAEQERHRMWQWLRSGERSVAVGARSALFAPIKDLGLVIVDEEHDGSFKQEEGVRYHARDMALLRAHRAGAVAVLGSATPSLESVALLDKKKMTRLRLRERATNAALPLVEVIDLKRYRHGPKEKLLSKPLVDALTQTFEAGEQSIVFLNRRGFAPAVICNSCGHVQACEQCSVALTYHRRHSSVRCHYCDFQRALPETCSECKSGPLILEGLGTEKLEGALAEALPTARIARMDRDVASGLKSMKILDRMRRGEIDVLVGTQMVTKGHDLPNVTLVGVINADATLSLPDFRASERGFQLLVQVAGRAGRRERQGRVLIQTRDPEHPAIAHAIKHDVDGFLRQELEDRSDVGYPPFRHLALVRIDAVDEGHARDAANTIASAAKRHPALADGSVELLGPAAAPLARLRNRYRFRVMLRSTERRPLRSVVASILNVQASLPRKVRSTIDMDPVSML